MTRRVGATADMLHAALSKGGNMVTVKVRDIRSDPGFGGSTQRGTVTVSAVIRSDELGRLEIAVQIPKQGDEEQNAHEARAVLQRFSQQFSEALTQPLAFE